MDFHIRKHGNSRKKSEFSKKQRPAEKSRHKNRVLIGKTHEAAAKRESKVPWIIIDLR